ncbi:hypothetical protein GW916_00015 [bacterium]|nr:hypothetical protein [bacterium]
MLRNHNIAADIVGEFSETCEKISQILNECEVHVRPSIGIEFPHFSRLETPDKKVALMHAKNYLASLEVEARNLTVMGGVSANGLWSILNVLGVLPPSDLFSNIGPGDTIEAYDLNHVQIWRNINFMKICSYTLEEIFCIPWPQRYLRSPEMTQACISRIGALLLESGPSVVSSGVSAHRLEETMSTQNYILDAHFHTLARLTTRDKQLAGYLVVSKVQIIGKRTGLDPSRELSI